MHCIWSFPTYTYNNKNKNELPCWTPNWATIKFILLLLLLIVVLPCKSAAFVVVRCDFRNALLFTLIFACSLHDGRETLWCCDCWWCILFYLHVNIFHFLPWILVLIIVGVQLSSAFQKLIDLYVKRAYLEYTLNFHMLIVDSTSFLF